MTYSELRDKTGQEPNSYAVHYRHHEVPGYKHLWLQQKQNNKVLLGYCAVSTAFALVCVAASIAHNAKLQAENIRWNDERKIAMNMLVTYADYSTQLENRVLELQEKLPAPVRGKVSYYSRSGCLGCSPTQTMANGVIFDESKYTLAFNKYPLNTVVQVKNLSNGKIVNAMVTDRGGFETHGRIADLSKATCDAIDCKTDQSLIEISL